MKLHVLGIDLGKTVFHLVGLDSTGRLVIRKRCSRRQLLAFTANLEVQLIGMEACSGAHFLGRALREQGHEVRLMPAQYVKPYVQTNKSDYLDAEAIAEAVQRPRMRFVPIKTGGAARFASAASRARALGDAAHRGGEPDSQSSSGTRADSA
jgi:transposase